MQESVNQDREKFIGGSDIPIIMELSPFKSRFDLLLEKAGYKKDNFEGNVFTDYGNTMESKIRDHINSKLISSFVEGKHIEEIPAEWDVTPNGMKIRCHTDGECDDYILEIKTTPHTYDSVDKCEFYLVQLLFYMLMTGKEHGILAVYKRPDDMSEELDADALKTFEIRMSDYTDLINRIVNAVIRFLDDLQKVKSNPFITEEELLPADVTEIASKIVAYEQQLSRMKELEKKVKSEKNRLKDAMERAGVKKWETNDGFTITLIPDAEDKIVTNEYFNADKFMAEHPELVEKYMETKREIQRGEKGHIVITPSKEKKS